MPITDRMIAREAGVKLKTSSTFFVAAPGSGVNHPILIAKQPIVIRDVKLAAETAPTAPDAAPAPDTVDALVLVSPSGAGALATITTTRIALAAGVVMASREAVSLFTGEHRVAGANMAVTVGAGSRNLATGDVLFLRIVVTDGGGPGAPSAPALMTCQVEYVVDDQTGGASVLSFGSGG